MDDAKRSLKLRFYKTIAFVYDDVADFVKQKSKLHYDSAK